MKKALIILIFSAFILPLTAQNDEEHIKNLIDELASDNLEDREKATEELIKVGEAALDALQEATKSSDAEVRARAELIINRIKLRLPKSLLELVPDIERILLQGNKNEKIILLNSITGHVGSEQENEWHCKCWVDKPRYNVSQDDLVIVVEKILEKGFCGRVIHIVQAAKIQTASKTLLKFLDDQDASIRSQVIYALADIADKAIASEVVNFLKHEDPGVRSDALLLLSMLKATDQVHEIARLLSDPDNELRRHAVQILAEMGAKDYAADLWKLAQQDNWTRRDAIEAVGKLGAREYINNLIDLITKSDKYDNDSWWPAARALEHLQAKECIPAMVELAKSDDEVSRYRAIYVLGHNGSKLQATECLPTIANALNDSDSSVRAFACSAIGRFKAKEYTESIVKILKDQDAWVKQYAINALVELEARGFAKDIAEQLKDTEWFVRYAAAVALGSLGAIEFKAEIENLLNDENETVRHGAKEALKKFKKKK